MTTPKRPGWGLRILQVRSTNGAPEGAWLPRIDFTIQLLPAKSRRPMRLRVLLQGQSDGSRGR
jgi:hypothetical protein